MDFGQLSQVSTECRGSFDDQLNPSGFVSGHACNSWALAVFVWVTLSPGYRRLRQALLLWAGLISYSRIYNGVHYPGDVLGGALLGAFLGYGFARLFGYFFGTWLLFVAKLAERRHR